MKRSRWLTFLMVITLLVITGFQGWWLFNNYQRERSALAVKTRVLFEQTVRDLQFSKLKFRIPFSDSTHKSVKRIMVREQRSDIKSRCIYH